VARRSTALTRSVSRALSVPGRITAVGLELPESLPLEQWLGLGERLQQLERSVLWWIGDWWRFGQRKYGKAAETAAVTGKAYQTVRDAAWVASQFSDLSRRRDNLTWSHHREVAALPQKAQDQLLNQAERQGWSRNELRFQVARWERREAAPETGRSSVVRDLGQLIRGNRRFRTIYADPPWPYDNQGTRAATGEHYPSLSVDEIAHLPIAELAAPECHLHLWTTNAFLFEAKEVLDAWGFAYKSCFVWVKPQMGIGNYWRVAHEFLLFGQRGASPFLDHSQISWLEAERGPHSEKPGDIRRLIETVSSPPYLELFARQPHKGWTVWGNEL